MRRKAKVKKWMQRRADDLKSLIEQRADLVQEMNDLTNTAETEKRAFTPEEDAKFDELEGKVKTLDTTIEKMERARSLKMKGAKKDEKEDLTEKEQAEKEERAFANYIRSCCGEQVLETRAGEQNLTMGNNGAIIPTTIANRIINTVRDICPIYAKATIYHVNGTLKIPVWGKANTTHGIKVGYQEEFTEIIADSGKFSSIDLSGYLVGALTLIGKTVVNNAQVDVVSFIVTEMAKEIAAFIEKELLIGTSGKAQGALDVDNTVETASATAITMDDLITVQASVKQAYQKNACWVVNSATFTAFRKLKDGNNRYLLQDDITGEFPYRLLGKPVYVSDNMPVVAAGTKPVLYGDLSGLSVNVRENVQIQVLQEKYATQHAVGVVAWLELDSKVSDSQKMATLTMKAA
nr:MAG TPA: major capsid protein [Caudoviricetes sp.]